MGRMVEVQRNRICPKCRISYLVCSENFHKDSQKPDGFSYRCKFCLRKDNKDYQDKHKHIWKQQRLDKRNASLNDVEYQQKKKEESLKKIRATKKRYADKNRQALNKKSKERYAKGLVKITPEQRKKYKDKEYNKIKLDPYLKLKHYSRVRINDLIKKNRLSFKHENCILFTKNEFLTHIEYLFLDGMNWNNYGTYGWHIDHKIPLCHFNLNNPEEFKSAWSLQNLQPLWAKDNLRKATKLI